MFWGLLFILSSLCLTVSTNYSYNILLMCPFPAPSHWMWIENYAVGLLDRGHHVTAITNHKSKHNHPNYTEIIINPQFNIPAYFPKSILFELKYNSDFQNLLMWWKVGLLTSEHALNDTKVRTFIQQKNLKFDLILLEQFFHESFLMFGYRFNAPIITLGTFGYADNMDRAMGLMTPWSFVPHLVLPYKDNMTFWQRSYNTFLSLFDLVMRRWHYIPKQQILAEKYFSSIGENLPSVLELERNISMMLINSHRSMDAPRPTMPGLVNVGGIHIKPVKTLPQEIQDFLDRAEFGAIYFSLGSYVKSNEMPKEKLAILLEAFSKLTQHVLWKYEDDSIGTLPKNVMVHKWMPQNDILAHKNIVLFITHGGIFGTQEAIYRAVPMLFIPLFGDQHRNSIKCVREGYGLSIEFSTISVECLTEKIKTIINNKAYKKKIMEASNIFRDNIVPPLDEAMYWIEYVARHKGSPHIKSAAVNLYWYEYILLDVFAFYTSVILFSLFIIYKLIVSLTKLILTKNVKHSSKKNN